MLHAPDESGTVTDPPDPSARPIARSGRAVHYHGADGRAWRSRTHDRPSPVKGPRVHDMLDGAPPAEGYHSDLTTIRWQGTSGEEASLRSVLPGEWAGVLAVSTASTRSAPGNWHDAGHLAGPVPESSAGRVGRTDRAAPSRQMKCQAPTPANGISGPVFKFTPRSRPRFGMSDRRTSSPIGAASLLSPQRPSATFFP